MGDASIGVLSRMGLISVANWDTAWPGSATTYAMISESLTAQFNRIENDSLVGYGGQLPSDQGVKTISGSTEHYLDYATTHQLIGAVFGDIDTGPSPSEVTIVDRHGSGSENHYFVELDKGHSQFRFGPGLPTKITISGEKDAYIKLTIDWLFRDLDIVSSGYTGGAFTEKELALYDQMVFRLADQTDALASGDEMNIDSFEITVDRNMKGDDHTSNSTDPKLPIRPVENGFRVSELSISFPRFENNTIQTWKDDDEALLSDMTLTGSAGTIIFSMPNIRISDGFDANVGGPEALKLEGGFDLYRDGTDKEVKMTYSY